MATAADAQVAVIDAPGPFTLKDWAKAPLNEPKVESAFGLGLSEG